MPDRVIELEAGAAAPGGRPILRHVDLTVRGRVRRADGSQRLPASRSLVRALTGLHPLASGSPGSSGRCCTTSTTGGGSGSVPQRGGATSGVPPRSGSRRVRAPDPAAPPAPLGPGRPRSDRRALEVVGLADRSLRRRPHACRGPAAACSSPGRSPEPGFFFLDEPTAGVDLPTSRCWPTRWRRCPAGGATIVLVAHELGPLAPLIDRAVVMRDGRMAYDGPPLASDQVATAHLDERARPPPPRAGAPRPRAPHRLAAGGPPMSDYPISSVCRSCSAALLRRCSPVSRRRPSAPTWCSAAWP